MSGAENFNLNYAANVVYINSNVNENKSSRSQNLDFFIINLFFYMLECQLTKFSK